LARALKFAGTQLRGGCRIDDLAVPSVVRAVGDVGEVVHRPPVFTDALA
jgi:hypothetical protein